MYRSSRPLVCLRSQAEEPWVTPEWIQDVRPEIVRACLKPRKRNRHLPARPYDRRLGELLAWFAPPTARTLRGIPPSGRRWWRPGRNALDRGYGAGAGRGSPRRTSADPSFRTRRAVWRSAGVALQIRVIYSVEFTRTPMTATAIAAAGPLILADHGAQRSRPLGHQDYGQCES